jgi:hypothetical protein
MLEAGLPHPAVLQALKAVAESGGTAPHGLVEAMVTHCGLYLPGDDDVQAAHEAVAYFLECLNEEVLANPASGPALHDHRDQLRTVRILDKVNANQRSLDELLLRMKPPDEALSDLIAQSERENPGLSFAARTTAQGTIFEVSVRRGGGPMHVGTLSFPATEGGQRGREKFRCLVEEGRVAELEADEARWSPAFSVPGDHASDISRIVISPSVRSRVVPVRIESTPGVALVDYAELRLVRAGTKEQELNLSAGRLAGAATFIVRAQGASGVSFERSGGAASVADALRTTDFFLNLASGVPVSVVALETGVRILTFTGREDRSWIERLRGERSLLQDLRLINERLALDLQYPGVADQESAFNARILAEGIRYGRVSQVRMVDSSGTTERRVLQTIVERADTAIQLAMGDPRHAFTLFGRTVEVPCRVVLSEPIRADFDKDQERCADPGPEDLVTARIAWSRITYEFPEWSDGGPV